jgi:hypothetical protein
MRTTSRAVYGASLLLLIAGARFAAAQQKREDYKTSLPPGPAKPLIETRCSVCHDLGVVVRARKPKPAWEATVMRMIDQGASLIGEEETQASDYLSTVFGPDAPPLTDVNTATEDDLTKLPGITPELAARIVAHRTNEKPVESRDEIKTLLGLDEEAFEKIKWYLRPAGAAPAP